MTQAQRETRETLETMLAEAETAAANWRKHKAEASWAAGQVRECERRAAALRAALASLTAAPDIQTRLERAETALAHVRQQAGVWKQEARAQKATVDGVGALVGLPDYGPIVDAVRQLRERADATAGTPGELVTKLRTALEGFVDGECHCDEDGVVPPCVQCSARDALTWTPPAAPVATCQHKLKKQRERCGHGLPWGTTCEQCILSCAKCWDMYAASHTYGPRPTAPTVAPVAAPAPVEPKVRGRCTVCRDTALPCMLSHSGRQLQCDDCQSPEMCLNWNGGQFRCIRSASPAPPEPSRADSECACGHLMRQHDASGQCHQVLPVTDDLCRCQCPVATARPVEAMPEIQVGDVVETRAGNLDCVTAFDVYEWNHRRGFRSLVAAIYRDPLWRKEP